MDTRSAAAITQKGDLKKNHVFVFVSVRRIGYLLCFVSYSVDENRGRDDKQKMTTRSDVI